VRDARTLEVLRRVPARTGRYTVLALSPNVRVLAAGREDGSLRLVDLRSGKVRTGGGPKGARLVLATFTPDGDTVVTGDSEGGVTSWDVHTAESREELVGHQREVAEFAISGNGETLYSAGLDRRVIAWDLGGKQRLGRPFRAGAGGTGNYIRVALSADGRLFAFGQLDGSVRIVDARTFEVLAELPPGPQSSGMTFVPGSHLLVATDVTGFMRLADADTGRIVWRVRAHKMGAINTPGVSADGRLMVTSSRNHKVRLWSLPDGSPLGALTFDGFLTDAQISPDGRRIAVALYTRMEIWDVRTRRRVRTLDMDGGVGTARFSPSGRLIALGNSGGVRVYSTADWTPITRLLSGHSGSISWVVIGRDDRTLATSSPDGTVRLWDINSERALGAPLPGLPGHGVTGLLTPDGGGVIAGYDTGQAYRWDIRSQSLVRQACQIAGRTLTRAEWEEFLPGRDYRPACSG